MKFHFGKDGKFLTVTKKKVDPKTGSIYRKNFFTLDLSISSSPSRNDDEYVPDPSKVNNGYMYPLKVVDNTSNETNSNSVNTFENQNDSNDSINVTNVNDVNNVSTYYNIDKNILN